MPISVSTELLLSSIPFQKLVNRGTKNRSNKNNSSSINNNTNHINSSETPSSSNMKSSDSTGVKKSTKKGKNRLNGMKVRTIDSYFMKLPPTPMSPSPERTTISVLSPNTSPCGTNPKLNHKEVIEATTIKLPIKSSNTKSKFKSEASLAAVAQPPPPKFQPYGAVGCAEIVWEKLAVRDFMTRFEKYGGFPNRYKSSINRPQDDWDPRLYKSLLLTGMRILADDSDLSHSSVSASSSSGAKIWRAHLTTLEKHSDGASVGDRMRVETDPVELTRKFLVENLVDPGVPAAIPPTHTEKSNDEDATYENSRIEEDRTNVADDRENLAGEELAWLRVVNTVFRLAAQTPTLRSALSSQTKAAAEQAFKADMARAQHAMETRIDRLPPTTPFFSHAKNSDGNNVTGGGNDGAQPSRHEQMAEIRLAHAMRVRAAERRHNLRVRVQAPRTAPIGRDRAGCVYWHFPFWASTTDESVDYFVVSPAEPTGQSQTGPATVSDGFEADLVDVDMDSEMVKLGDSTSMAARLTDLQCIMLTRENLKTLIAWLRSERSYSPIIGSVAAKEEEEKEIEVKRLEDYAKKLLAMVE